MRYTNRHTLSTPESVELEYHLAGVGNRVFALIVDYSLLLILLLVYWTIWVLFALQLFNYLSQLGGDYSAVPIWLLGIAILGNFVLYSGYFVFFELLWRGQTPGKRMAKIRVVREDGRPLGVSQSVLRSLLRPIDDFIFLGLLFIVFSKQEKRIGDWVAGTLVVQVEPQASKAQLQCSEAAHRLAPDLPSLTTLDALSPDDFAILREYLTRRASLTRPARQDLSMKLAHQTRQRIQLETIPADTSSDDFLEAVYLAYQQVHQGLSWGERIAPPFQNQANSESERIP